MSKPEVDFIKGIPPSIAIEQKVNTRNPRSTVGTSTEIYEYLKLLFVRIGKTISPVSGQVVQKHQVEDVVAAALSYPEGTRIMILAPIHNTEGRSVSDKLQSLQLEGFSRIIIDERVCSIDELLQTNPEKEGQELLLLIDRLTADRSKAGISRLSDSIETAFSEGKDEYILLALPEGQVEERQRFS